MIKGVVYCLHVCLVSLQRNVTPQFAGRTVGRTAFNKTQASTHLAEQEGQDTPLAERSADGLL